MLSNRVHGYFCRWSAEDNHYHVRSHTAKRFILIKLCPFHVVLWMFHAARDSDYHPFMVSVCGMIIAAVVNIQIKSLEILCPFQLSGITTNRKF